MPSAVSRRSLLAGVLTVTAAIAVPPRKSRKYGRLNPEGWIVHKNTTGEFLRVTIDGRDVTQQCYESDDVEGYVKVFCRDKKMHDWTQARSGVHLGEDGAICSMRISGRVEIRPGEPI